MIYMVDHVYGDPATEPAWHEWYADYLRKLVAVPGIHTAQRFKAIGQAPSRYLAMYSIDSADVYTSDAYRRMGGGGSQSARFHGAYRLWTRNLFDAAGSGGARGTPVRAPAVAAAQRVLVFDRDALPPGRDGDSFAAPGAPDSDAARLASRATWLEAVGLHMTTKYRAFVVLDAAEAGTVAAVPAGFLYEPYTPVIREAGSP